METIARSFQPTVQRLVIRTLPRSIFAYYSQNRACANIGAVTFQEFSKQDEPHCLVQFEDGSYDAWVWRKIPGYDFCRWELSAANMRD
jgi:hypothetical protein